MGRPHSAVRNTIGYFSVSLFLRVKLSERDTFRDLLQRVAREYCAVYEHADSGRIASQTPTPQFVSNPRFNWIPSEFDIGPAGSIHTCETQDDTELKQRRSVVIPRDDFDARGGAPELILSDTKEGIVGTLWYRADLFASDTVRQFQLDFQFLVERMVSEPETAVSVILAAP
jgi:hypothetical protein